LLEEIARVSHSVALDCEKMNNSGARFAVLRERIMPELLRRLQNKPLDNESFFKDLLPHERLRNRQEKVKEKGHLCGGTYGSLPPLNMDGDVIARLVRSLQRTMRMVDDGADRVANVIHFLLSTFEVLPPGANGLGHLPGELGLPLGSNGMGRPPRELVLPPGSNGMGLPPRDLMLPLGLPPRDGIIGADEPGLPAPREVCDRGPAPRTLVRKPEVHMCGANGQGPPQLRGQGSPQLREVLARGPRCEVPSKVQPSSGVPRSKTTSTPPVAAKALQKHLLERLNVLCSDTWHAIEELNNVLFPLRKHMVQLQESVAEFRQEGGLPALKLPQARRRLQNTTTAAAPLQPRQHVQLSHPSSFLSGPRRLSAAAMDGKPAVPNIRTSTNMLGSRAGLERASTGRIAVGLAGVDGPCSEAAERRAERREHGRRLLEQRKGDEERQRETRELRQAKLEFGEWVTAFHNYEMPPDADCDEPHLNVETFCCALEEAYPQKLSHGQLKKLWATFLEFSDGNPSLRLREFAGLGQVAKMGDEALAELADMSMAAWTALAAEGGDAAATRIQARFRGQQTRASLAGRAAAAPAFFA